MTGTIVELTGGRRTGVIRAEDGSRILFSATAVLGDYDMLDVGCRVRFDVQPAWPQPNAVGVREDSSRPGPSGKLKQTLDLRYMGFEQARSIRSYRFDAVSGGYSIRRYVVTVDVALLLKLNITVQEAPQLCLRKLTAALERSPAALRHELGKEDLLAHAAARAASARPKFRPRHVFGRRRGAPPPGPARRQK